MRTFLAAAIGALSLACAAPAGAGILPPLPLDPPIEPPPLDLPPLDILNTLPTHGVDPLTISIALEVPVPIGGSTGAPLDSGVTIDAESVRRAEPSSWCGTERATDATDPVLANGANRYHAIYAYPADAPSRFAALASDMQTDAFQASGLLERLYGRAIRLDMGTSCGPRYVDISSVRLRHTTAQLQSVVATPNGTYATVLDDLEAAGFPNVSAGEAPSAFPGADNYLVWLDGPAPPGCGQGAFYGDTRRDAANANDAAGKVALVFRSGTGFCNSNAARHEIGHNIGAVQSSAPHSDGGGHCDDTAGDTMCLTTGPVDGDSFQSLYFDAHTDDYWGGLPWWTVDLSRFLCPGVACNVPDGLAARQAAPTDGDGSYSPSSSGTGGSGGSGTGTAPRATLTATHHGRRWRFRVRVRGKGRARVTVTCRRDGRRRRLLRKTVRLPATVRGRGICDARPQVRVKRLG